MATKATIQAQAIVVKDETTTDANTATRVGTVIENLADKSRPYTVYSALLTQSGTSAPTATVLENDLSGTPTLSYVTTGKFRITLTGEFTSAKTHIFLNPIMTASNNFVGAYRVDDDIIEIQTRQFALGSFTNFNSILTGASIEIRVYE
jgi:hypothetical protein